MAPLPLFPTIARSTIHLFTRVYPAFDAPRAVAPGDDSVGEFLHRVAVLGDGSGGGFERRAVLLAVVLDTTI